MALKSLITRNIFLSFDLFFLNLWLNAEKGDGEVWMNREMVLFWQFLAEICNERPSIVWPAELMINSIKPSV